MWARRGKATAERADEGGHGRTLLLRRPHGSDLEDEWRAGDRRPEGLDDLEELAPLDLTGQMPIVDLRSMAARPERTEVAAVPVVGAPVIVPATDARAAAISFRLAAVNLALREQEGEPVGPDARACAEHLLGLAAGDHEEVLASILLADPSVPAATWTVACYQIGDLSPSTLRDFPAAAAAVLTLAGCETAAHVAAELIVTNGDGVRWTALVRSGGEVVYQAMGPATASAASPTDLLAARHRWEDQLLMWAACPDDGLAGVAPADLDDTGDEPPISGARSGSGGRRRRHRSAVDSPELTMALADLGVDPGGPTSDPILVGVVLGQVLEKVRTIEARLPQDAPTDRPVGDRDPDAAAAPETDGMRAQLESLRADMALLRNENSSIRFENASLRTENTALRSENTALRSEHAELRSELYLALTQATTRTAAPSARPLEAGDGRGVVVPSQDRR